MQANTIKTTQTTKTQNNNNKSFIDAAEHRYVLSAKVADATGEAFVNLFGKEVRLFGLFFGCGLSD
jgi:hypothetical protein